MKKIIAIVLALSALTVSALAAGAPAPAVDAATSASDVTEKEIDAVLSPEDALAAALRDAGEQEADVTVTKNELSEKTAGDGRTVAVYTVKFSAGSTTWKYYVDGNTGAILYKRVEFRSADMVFPSRDRDGAGGRSDKSGGKASGEMSASGEMDETGERTGRSGGRAPSGEMSADTVLTDAVGA